MRRVTFFVVLSSVALSTFVRAQDDVAAPWGTANGDIYGRARSATIPMNFADEAEIAWQFDPAANGTARPNARSSIVFDEAGNIYWHSEDARLVSIDVEGALRFVASDTGGGVVSFGIGGNSVSPIVGGQYVYQLGAAGSGPAGEPLIAAVDKTSGLAAWMTLLPEAPSGDNLLTPILYAGKLYVVGESNGTNASVYQLDAASGDIDWQSTVPLAIQCRGTMALLPGLFGPGLHGLFFNGDSSSGTDGIGECYGLSIDSDPVTGGASLAWQADGGKVARSHVIANPDHPSGSPMLYTHTWADYGGTLYAFDAMSGAVVVNNNSLMSGHGFYDVGSLGFDNARVVAGGFDGNVIQYLDGGAGSTIDEVHQFYDSSPIGWFGEYRALGQLLEDAFGNPLLVTGTNSRVGDFGATHTARVVILDVNGAGAPQLSWDTGIAIDHWFTVVASPLIGPDGKLYYFDNASGVLVALEATTPPVGPLFTRGDVNQDGDPDISDAVFILAALFIPGSATPSCVDAADINDDGAFDISDAVFWLAYLFVPGGTTPPPPFVGCGEDTTADALDCLSFAPCL